MQYILVDRPTLGFEHILKQITNPNGRAIDQNALHLPKRR